MPPRIAVDGDAGGHSEDGDEGEGNDEAAEVHEANGSTGRHQKRRCKQRLFLLSESYQTAWPNDLENAAHSLPAGRKAC
jgi:hypothetical protein